MTITQKLVKHLTSLAGRRANGVVTADDAQRVLNRWNYRGNRSFIGGALLGNFKSVGYTRSITPTNRDRTIRVWKPVNIA